MQIAINERSLEETVWPWGVCRSKKQGLLVTYCDFFIYGNTS